MQVNEQPHFLSALTGLRLVFKFFHQFSLPCSRPPFFFFKSFVAPAWRSRAENVMSAERRSLIGQEVMMDKSNKIPNVAL